MAKAVGIGGIFFRAENPEALSAWYKEHLGIDPAPTDATAAPWMTEAGVTVFSPFAKGSDYQRGDKSFMVNFRVDDLDALVAHLAEGGTDVRNDQTVDGLVRFVHIEDPERTPIELWQPM